MKVTAAVATAPRAPLEILDLELDEPRPDEIRVRLVATGVCHTDAKVRDRQGADWLPAVLGHEGAGIVEAVGEEVAGLAIGDRVLLSFDHCGACANCRAGLPSYCDTYDARNFGGSRLDGSVSLRRDGRPVRSHFFGQSSFATHANVAAHSAIKVAHDAPLEALAPLGCGVQTGAGVVLNTFRPEPGRSFAVFGAGAVGMSALLAAVAADCGTIIAIDRNAERLALAAELGATHIIDPSTADVEPAIRSASPGGVDFALDTTGVAGVFTTMVRSLATRGHAGVVAGAPADAPVDFPTSALLGRGVRVSTIINGDSNPSEFVPELIRLWETGRFPFDRLVRTYPFEAVNDAFADSASGATIKPVLRFERAAAG